MTTMEKTGMLVLCVCLTFMSLGCTQETNTAVTNNSTQTAGTTQRSTATTPLSGHTSTHEAPNNHTTVTTRAPPASSTSAAKTSSQQPQTSRRPTQSSGATASTTRHPATATKTASTVTTKSGSASLFRSCSQLLVPLVSVLIYGA